MEQPHACVRKFVIVAPKSMHVVVVGRYSHDKMFDEISADLAKDGHRITRHKDSVAFAAADKPLADADILLCSTGCPVPRDAFGTAPRLRAIVAAVTGTDGIDVKAATEHAVVVANAQTEENITGMAEATVMLILAALYDFNGTQELLRKSLPRPEPLRARELRGKLVGIIGLGKIGRETARLLAPFGAKLQYTARRDAELTGLPPMPRVDLDTLMRTSDVVVLLASLNAETRGMIGADKLRLMKPTGIFVNVARGGIVDDDALAELLRSGAIRGAALDCFQTTPLPADSPLRALPNVILTPFMVGHTLEAHLSLERAARENLQNAIAGKPPRYVVNPDVLPAWIAKWGARR